MRPLALPGSRYSKLTDTTEEDSENEVRSMVLDDDHDSLFSLAESLDSTERGEEYGGEDALSRGRTLLRRSLRMSVRRELARTVPPRSHVLTTKPMVLRSQDRPSDTKKESRWRRTGCLTCTREKRHIQGERKATTSNGRKRKRVPDDDSEERATKQSLSSKKARFAVAEDERGETGLTVAADIGSNTPQPHPKSIVILTPVGGQVGRSATQDEAMIDEHTQEGTYTRSPFAGYAENTQLVFDSTFLDSIEDSDQPASRSLSPTCTTTTDDGSGSDITIPTPNDVEANPFLELLEKEWNNPEFWIEQQPSTMTQEQFATAIPASFTEYYLAPASQPSVSSWLGSVINANFGGPDQVKDGPIPESLDACVKMCRETYGAWIAGVQTDTEFPTVGEESQEIDWDEWLASVSITAPTTSVAY